MEAELTIDDLKFIQESLKYTALKFEEYQKYPSYEYKQKRLEDVRVVAVKISDLIKSKKMKTTAIK